MKTKVYSTRGEDRGEEIALPEPLFDGTVHQAALHQVVTAIQAHDRQGTASTKGRTTITGGGRKPWRQKGTGRARHGSIRSPIWRGGAVTFGPSPREFRVKVPKKLKRLAIQSALNARALDGNLLLIEPFELERPRTRRIAELLGGLEAEEKNVTILTNGLKRDVYLSGRNLQRVQVHPWGEASAYDLLWADLLLVEKGAWSADAPGGGDAETEAAGEEGPADEDVQGGDEKTGEEEA